MLLWYVVNGSISWLLICVEITGLQWHTSYSAMSLSAKTSIRLISLTFGLPSVSICTELMHDIIVGCKAICEDINQLMAPFPLQWGHNGRDEVSNHRRLHCLHKRRSKKAKKLRVTGLCEGNSSVIGEFPAQKASNADNISIWWRHHAKEVRTASYCSRIQIQGYCPLDSKPETGKRHICISNTYSIQSHHHKS